MSSNYYGVGNTAQILQLEKKRTIDELINEVHRYFATAQDASNRAVRARIRAGRFLLKLRERIEAGEAGDVEWWKWYGANIVRSRRDGEKVMALARAADPEAAAEAERAANRESRKKNKATAASMTDRDADPSDEEDPVEQALGVVEGLLGNMTHHQRQRFFAAFRSRYAHQH